MKKLFCIIILAASIAGILCSCRQADKVSYNISKDADNFNITRRLEVINARTDRPVFELIGNFALDNNGENELEVTVELEDGTYKKHFVYLNEWTIYVVEDVSGSYVDPYHYEVNFLPEMIVPVTLTMDD